MGVLKELYDALNNELSDRLPEKAEAVTYRKGGAYITIEDGRIKKLNLLEELVLKGNKETLAIADLGDEVIVAYAGSTNEMKQTLSSLGLPERWPNDLGQKVLTLFKESLEGLEGIKDPVHLEVAVTPDKVEQFMSVLKALARKYTQQRS